MNCLKCGAVLRAEAKFCDQCGEKVAGQPQIIVNQNIGSLAPGSKAYGVVINPQDPPEELLKAYYRALAAECSRLPLGVIDARFVQTSGDVPLPLAQVYVDLDVTTPPPQERGESERAWALKLERGAGRERRALLEALLEDPGRKTVLLGDAGSGKTTFVNYLTYALACEISGEAQAPELPGKLRGRLVVRLVLRDVAAQRIPPGARRGKAQMLWGALQDDIAARLGAAAAEKLLLFLQEQLLEKGGIILLDGLDEVPEAQRRREALREAVADFAGALSKERTYLLVTARPYAYADRAWRLAEFSTLALAPFNEEQVERFIDRWCQAARPFLGWNEAEAERRAGRLKQALEEREYLADLASRPLLLTLMAALHSSHGQLPEDRADLYEETVKLMLSRWQQARLTSAPDGTPVVEPGILQVLGIGEEKLRSTLETLAYRAHETQGRGAQRDEAPADISEAELLLAFRPLLGQVSPDTLLSYLKERAGLLGERRGGVYSFPHRSFQEYLAACYLADQPEFALELEKLVCSDPAWWREVCLFGIGKAKRGGMSQAVGVANHLLPADPPVEDEAPPNQWRVASLIGQALIELRLAEQAGGQDSYQALLKRSRKWLVQLLQRSRLPARERAAAGDALAELGDPRFNKDLWHLPDEPLLGFVRIPAGPFRMGSDKQRDKRAYNDELPQHSVHLPEYYLSRYPTTVAQFRAFIEERGEPPENPGSLRDPDNRPVRYVTWYEAVAYCRWLGEKLRALAQEKLNEALPPEQGEFWRRLRDGELVIGLPSEAEWEKAARGADGRIYPWKGDFDPDKANMDETGLGDTSAVGCFPGGASPYELLDMSGNVWEWTRSLWGDYPYPDDPQARREREDLQARGPRVARGGSFIVSEGYARCACRYWSNPDGWLRRLGFRVGASLLPLDSGRSETLGL
jgi:formylglycine-generating enzyme required for sulfatase activity